MAFLLPVLIYIVLLSLLSRFTLSFIRSSTKRSSESSRYVHSKLWMASTQETNPSFQALSPYDSLLGRLKNRIKQDSLQTLVITETPQEALKTNTDNVISSVPNNVQTPIGFAPSSLLNPIKEQAMSLQAIHWPSIPQWQAPSLSVPSLGASDSLVPIAVFSIAVFYATLKTLALKKRSKSTTVSDETSLDDADVVDMFEDRSGTFVSSTEPSFAFQSSSLPPPVSPSVISNDSFNTDTYPKGTAFSAYRTGGGEDDKVTEDLKAAYQQSLSSRKEPMLNSRGEVIPVTVAGKQTDAICRSLSNFLFGPEETE